MRVTALAGGVGGAKLVHGLAAILSPGELTVLVNTADDFEYIGLRISPDLDTVCYTLAGLANPKTGWGRDKDTWNAIEGIRELGGPDWFRIGDRDMATHLERTRRLSQGESLSQITAAFCKKWGVRQRVLPMTDDRVGTVLQTDEGELEFQEYFVRRQCRPKVRSIAFQGAPTSQAAPGVLEALGEADAIIICPSNPWVSIDPILSIKGIAQAMKALLTTAVSPIVGGRALKGPAAKMFLEMGIDPSAEAVAKHYGNRIGSFVLDRRDAHLEAAIQETGIQTLVCDAVMRTIPARRRLARDVLDFIVAGRQ
jgi:LPPG:FO 2-phospho-L-lactate transferase